MGTLALAAVGVAGSSVGAALGVPLVWPAAGRGGDSRLIGAALLAASVVVAIISSRLLGIVPDGAVAEHAINLAGLVAYPFVYLYLQRLALATGGGLATAALWVPVAVYGGAVGLRALLSDSTRVPFAWLLPVVLAYTLACLHLVVRARPSTLEPPEPLVPAVPLIAGLVLLNLAQIVRMAFSEVPPVRAIVPIVLTLEFVTLVAVVAWRARGIVLSAVPVLPATPRYERSGLADEAAQALAGRVEVILVERRLFADPGLTLARLADVCGSSSHQVSEALNRIAGETFHELVARHRVSDVKRQLEDPASDAYSIEGIGQSAGFGSRSTLYAAFKKAEGMTPAEFRARCRQPGRGRSDARPRE